VPAYGGDNIRLPVTDQSMFGPTAAPKRSEGVQATAKPLAEAVIPPTGMVRTLATAATGGYASLFVPVGGGQRGAGGGGHYFELTIGRDAVRGK
jgi:hypothetical protein